MSATDEQPFLADILARYHDDGPRLVYADWLDDHGIPWVDVQADFMGRDGQGVPRGRRDDLWLPHDPVHPTAEGQRIMAEAVTGLLRREQLVEP